MALDEFFEVDTADLTAINFTVKGGIVRKAESTGAWWIVHVIKYSSGVIKATNALSFSILDACQQHNIEITTLVPNGPTTEILTTGIEQNVYFVDEFVFKFFDTLSDYFDTTVEHTWLLDGTNPTWPCSPPLFLALSFSTTDSITTREDGYILADANYVAPSPTELLTISFAVYFYSYNIETTYEIASSLTAELMLGQCDMELGLNPVYTIATEQILVTAEMDPEFTFPADLFTPTGEGGLCGGTYTQTYTITDIVGTH